MHGYGDCDYVRREKQGAASGERETKPPGITGTEGREGGKGGRQSSPNKVKGWAETWDAQEASWDGWNGEGAGCTRTPTKRCNDAVSWMRG